MRASSSPRGGKDDGRLAGDRRGGTGRRADGPRVPCRSSGACENERGWERHKKGTTFLDLETLSTSLTRQGAIAAAAHKGVTVSFRRKKAEDEMWEVNDRTYARLFEMGAADVDVICAPSRMSILTDAALEGIRRYSDEYEFGCLTGSQLGSRMPKFG